MKENQPYPCQPHMLHRSKQNDEKLFFKRAIAVFINFQYAAKWQQHDSAYAPIKKTGHNIMTPFMNENNDS